MFVCLGTYHKRLNKGHYKTCQFQAFLLLSIFYLSTVTFLSVLVILLTEKLSEPIRQEIFALVGLDTGCAVALVGAVGAVLVQQNRSKEKDMKIREKKNNHDQKDEIDL